LAPYLPAPVVARRERAVHSTQYTDESSGDPREAAPVRQSADRSTGGTPHSVLGTEYYLDFDRPKSIGRVRSFFGNVGILFRGYCYIRTLGPDGLREVSEQAVLNANYLRARVAEAFDVPHPGPCMHEFVASARTLLRERKVRAM